LGLKKIVETELLRWKKNVKKDHHFIEENTERGWVEKIATMLQYW
jgi:hypothetical protein